MIMAVFRGVSARPMSVCSEAPVAAFPVIELKHNRDETRRKTIESMLSEMRNANVVVEGIHDVAALEHLRIRAHTYEKAMRSGLPLPGHVILFMDDDRRGSERAERLGAFFAEKGFSVDEKTGTRLLRLLNTAHVEDMLQPLAHALEAGRKAREETRKIGELNGENLFGHSKVHGGGKVLHKRVRRQT